MTTRADGRTPGRLTPNRFHDAAWVVGENLNIADYVWIGAFCVIDGLHDTLTIGPGAIIASGAHLYTHSTVLRFGSEGKAPTEHLPTVIGEHVSVCANAVVLMGCAIGHHSVIGAGAVVPQRTICDPYAVLVGVPAKTRGWLDPEALVRGEWQFEEGYTVHLPHSREMPLRIATLAAASAWAGELLAERRQAVEVRNHDGVLRVRCWIGTDGKSHVREGSGCKGPR